MDRRIDILNSEYHQWVDEKGVKSIYPNNFPEAYKESAMNAMDERGKQMCLELLEYMAKNNIECGICKEGPFFLQKKNMQYKAYTKEELFNNFL